MYQVPRTELTVELPEGIEVFEGEDFVELICTRCMMNLGAYTTAVDGGILLIDAELHRCR